VTRRPVILLMSGAFWPIYAYVILWMKERMAL
jgi:hypothetical protein